MLVIIQNSEEIIYPLKQLHLRLGIEFIDDVFITDKYLSRSNFLEHSIIISAKDYLDSYSNNKNLIIKTDIINLIKSSQSMSYETDAFKDSLERVSFEESRRLSSASNKPEIDLEILKIRKVILKYLDNCDIRYKIKHHPAEGVLCLTHDVDSIKGKSYLRYFYWIIRHNPKRSFSMIVNTIKSKHDPEGPIKQIVSLEKKYNFKSTFFFLSLPFFIWREGRRYRFASKLIKKHINFLKKNYCEIGIHPSRAAYLNSNIFERELSRFKAVTGLKNNEIGVRNHYLSGSFPKLWDKYAQSGLLYDASLGWHDAPGFRALTSMPFKPLNKSDNSSYDIYELPLIIMDGTFKEKTSNEIFNSVKQIIDLSLKSNSLVTILWHTDRIFNDMYKGHSDAYKMILQYMQKNNYVSLTIKQMLERLNKYEFEMKKNIRIKP